MDVENNIKHSGCDLKIYDPDWGSPLASVIIELEKLREKRLSSHVPPYIFFQLKEIFHIFESLGSARIEGNRTTLSDFVEKIIADPSEKSSEEKFIEIYNIERAIDFIEKNVTKKTMFDRIIISEIHKILVDGLTPPPYGEGSKYPGQLRQIQVSISGSSHIPPDPIKVRDYFEELLVFVNTQTKTQYHLLSTALAHHRMAWIHPFDNGNGRLIRMFTYALLIKQGFQVKSGRILNPSAIFCMDRNKYYEMLSKADSGEKSGVLDWCFYVLGGLKTEIEKIDKLLNFSYMVSTILLPVLGFALDRKHITKQEFDILNAVVKSDEMLIKSKDIARVTGTISNVQRSRIIKGLKDKRMLVPIKENGRIYTIGFANNYLLRGVMHALEKNGFIPELLNKK